MTHMLKSEGGDHGLVALHGADLLKAALKVFVEEFSIPARVQQPQNSLLHL